MKLFPYGHATHPQWQMAAGLVLAQVRAQMALPEYASQPTLGILYITDHYANQAQSIFDHLRDELSNIAHWSGTVGVGVSSNNVEYFDEPALVLMLCDLPVDQFQVFNGLSPLGQAGPPDFVAQTALIHADAQTPQISELIEDVADLTTQGYVFGGLASSRHQTIQFSVNAHGSDVPNTQVSGVFEGGLSGVAFSSDVAMVSRVTQGCQPVGITHIVTEAQGHLVLKLNDFPALYVLMAELGVSLDEPLKAIPQVRSTLVGLSSHNQSSIKRTGEFEEEVMVRHIIGLDPQQHGVAVAHSVEVGMQLTFCQRDAAAARADLLRIGSEIREALEPEDITQEVAMQLSDQDFSAPHPARRMAGAIYVSCSGRGGPHFGGPSAELQLLRRALGDLPLVGFFASGEIAHRNLYGYTGVLTVFTTKEN